VKKALRWIGGIALAIAVLIAITLPMYADYTPRTRVASALAYVVGAREGLETACVKGTFASARSVLELGIADGAPPARVEKLELVRVSPTVLRIKARLQEIEARPFYGLFREQAIPPGKILEYEFTCVTDSAVTHRFVGTDVDPKYLPSFLRSR
jgi:hypothetical protein